MVPVHAALALRNPKLDPPVMSSCGCYSAIGHLLSEGGLYEQSVGQNRYSLHNAVSLKYINCHKDLAKPKHLKFNQKTLLIHWSSR